MKKIVRLTESELVRLVKKVIEEQEPTKLSTDCLSAAGFVKKKDIVANNQVGKPMVKSGGYEGIYKGKKTRLTVHGDVEIDEKNNYVTGKWKCENGKLVIYNIDKSKMPNLPFE